MELTDELKLVKRKLEAARVAIWRGKNPEKYKAANRKWYADKGKEYYKEYYQKRKLCKSE